MRIYLIKKHTSLKLDKTRSVSYGNNYNNLTNYIKSCFVILSILTIALNNIVYAEEKKTDVIRAALPSSVMVYMYDEKGENSGTGSGFFITKNEIITNYHVLEGASKASIKTQEGERYDLVKIIAEDICCDMIRASVNITDENIKPLPINENLPEIGENLIVIGSPQGLFNTVSEGIVSALREYPKNGKVIQTNAAISPGSSGGPVLNMKGEVVGITCFYYKSGQNLNFAIPISNVSTLIKKDIAIGKWQKTALSIDKVEEYFQNKNDADAFYRLGNDYFTIDQYGNAVKYFNRAINLGFGDISTKVYLVLGLSYFELDRYQDAIDALKICEKTKQYSEEYHLYGIIAESLFQLSIQTDDLSYLTDARTYIRKEIKNHPDNEIAHFILGNICLCLEKYNAAVDSYKLSIALKPDTDTYQYLGAAYAELGKQKEAIEAYRQAIEINHDNSEAYIWLGETYLAINNKKDALKVYKELKCIDKNMADNLFDKIYKPIEKNSTTVQVPAESPDNSNTNTSNTSNTSNSNFPKSGHTKSLSSNRLVKTNIVGFGILIDENKWKEGKTTDSGKIGFTLISNKYIVATIISDNNVRTQSMLKERVLNGIPRDAGTDLNIVMEENRSINGIKVLCMQTDFVSEGSTLTSWGYYYAGRLGTLLVSVYVPSESLKEYKQDILDFLNGIIIFE